MNILTKASTFRKKLEKDIKIIEDREKQFTEKEYEVNQWVRTDMDKYREHQIEKLLNECEKDALLAKRILDRITPIIKGEDHKDYVFFITIRPIEDSITFEHFKKLVMKLCSQKMIVDYELVFEQKGECAEELGKGFHCHILSRVKATTRKNHIIERIQSQFMGYVGKNQPFVQPMTENKNIAYYQKYITDGKFEIFEKMTARDFDDDWREQNNIENIYKGGEPL